MKKILFWSMLTAGVIAIFFFMKAVFNGSLILNPYLLSVGAIKIKWYGAIIGSSVIVAYLLARHQLLKEGVKEDEFLLGMVFVIPFAVLGGRLYYVAFTWSYFSKHLNLVLDTRTGGMAIHGALFATFLMTEVFILLRRKIKGSCSFSYLQAMDAFAMVVPFAQAMGRWGNFFNYEAYGAPTNLPWKMFVPPQYRMPQYMSYKFFTPTFLYETIADLIVFYIVYTYTQKKRTRFGQTFALYLILYSVFRFFNESFRLDSLWFYNLRIAQVVSVVLIIIGAVLFAYVSKNGKRVEEVRNS
ncbi:prolipoprotein diacylglyceryl transferase [Mesoaciditoga lauensis]|uniref:prolipoprotein diacylglyceryl transferase n=1 Tax=Mesoaciditoga lauensis TaxID=1495039 RepID=UPI0006912727|nr:prolipoprotein diacylglyceryl transferase [Mesoaciditoga lauensis]